MDGTTLTLYSSFPPIILFFCLGDGKIKHSLCTVLDIFSSPLFICPKWSCSTCIFGVKNKQGSCSKHTHRVITSNLNIYMWQCFAGRKRVKESSHGNIYLLMNQYWRGLDNKEFYMWQCCSKLFSNFHWLMLKKSIKKKKKKKKFN